LTNKTFARRKPMRIGVPKETAPGEKRVATVPDVVEKLVKLGFTVAVESGAGDAANFADDTYRAAGAEVLPTAAELGHLRHRLQGARAQRGRSG
jgi:H+-translocating NAD(P) transhydrogenase subunit alpha